MREELYPFLDREKYYFFFLPSSKRIRIKKMETKEKWHLATTLKKGTIWEKYTRFLYFSAHSE